MWGNDEDFEQRCSNVEDKGEMEIIVGELLATVQSLQFVQVCKASLSVINKIDKCLGDLFYRASFNRVEISRKSNDDMGFTNNNGSSLNVSGPETGPRDI